jgi:quercetin dioxygenase-like cupin family protein
MNRQILKLEAGFFIDSRGSSAVCQRGADRHKVKLKSPMECHVTTLNPGQAPHPPHQHAQEELFIVKEGTAEALVNGEWKRLGPGSVVFQASHTPARHPERRRCPRHISRDPMAHVGDAVDFTEHLN